MFQTELAIATEGCLSYDWKQVCTLTATRWPIEDDTDDDNKSDSACNAPWVALACQFPIIIVVDEFLLKYTDP